MSERGFLSCLDAVERRFVELTTPPNPLSLDGAVLGCGLPPRPEPLDQLRVLLLKRQTSWLTKDAVWKELVRRAHDHPEPWVTATVAMMIPGLKSIAVRLNSRYPGDRADLDSEILEGFLQALDLAEPDQPRLYSQLYFAAFRRGHEVCNRESRLLRRQARLENWDGERYQRNTTGHPDLVLADAVRQNAMTHEQAGLLAEIHLDGESRSAIAERRGLSEHQYRRQLAQARRKLVNFLRDRAPDLAA